MKVAIIGAGIAGLSAARALMERGMEVKVYEKSRGAGGRLATKRLDWATVDLGAQYFTARDTRFRKQLECWLEKGVVKPWNFQPHVVNEDELQLKPDNTSRYVAVPGMTRLAHEIGGEATVCFNTRIVGIERHSKCWRLKSSESDYIDEVYDWLLLSLPAEQSRQLLGDSPMVTEVPKDIHEPCWALALATRGIVSPEVQGVFADGEVSWLSRLSARNSRCILGDYDDLWMLHFSSKFSQNKDQGLRSNLAAIGFNWLRDILKDHVRSELQLVHTHQHYWRYARVRDSHVKPKLIADEYLGLAIIGDWTFGGRIEGAYLSGLTCVENLF